MVTAFSTTMHDKTWHTEPRVWNMTKRRGGQTNPGRVSMYVHVLPRVSTYVRHQTICPILDNTKRNLILVLLSSCAIYTVATMFTGRVLSLLGGT